MPSPFIFLVCQQGNEPFLKSQLLNDKLPFRLAFSRPGLLTFKVSQTGESLDDSADVLTRLSLPDWPLIRHCGYGLGQVRGEDADALVTETYDLAGHDWANIHVFQRDTALPGTRGFEPGPNELTKDILQRFRARIPERPAAPLIDGARILDVIIIEPNQWLVGYHLAGAIHTHWNGGCPDIAQPPMMISRAYLKIAEAIQWSQLPLEPDDAICEIGSAPGGACQRLLDLGLNVTGIDPAEMSPLLLDHPRFEHWRSKSSGIRRRQFSKFRWLAADANVAPSYTLEAVEDIVNYPSTNLEGLLLTLKLSTVDAAKELDQYVARVRGWGYPNVKVRQLAHNRSECCLAASR